MSPPTGQPTVIFYRYEGSPFAHKVDLLLALRRIPHFTVLVPMIPPRPELLLLGITYRRVPVLAIGDTVYCDTFKIAEALEELYPDSETHPSLFPQESLKGTQSVVAQRLLVQFWTDRPLFLLAVGLVPWKMLPKALVQDRASMREGSVDMTHLEPLKPYTISKLKVHLSLLEQQLQASDTKFLTGSERPGMLDVSAYFALKWLQELGVGEELFGKKDGGEFARLCDWMTKVEKVYQDSKPHSPSTEISASEANDKIPEPKIATDLKPTTTDETLFGLGTQVDVEPDDYGKVATSGKLVEINQKDIVVVVERRDGSSRGCKVCFPRLGFNVMPAKGGTT